MKRAKEKRGPKAIRFIFIAGIIISAFALFSASSASPSSWPIIPWPTNLQAGHGFLTFSSQSSIILNRNDPDFIQVAEYLQARLRPATGWPWEIKPLTESKSLRGHIFLRLLSSREDLGKEGYELRISPTHVLVDAASLAGIFYGLQTILQLFPPEIESSSPLPGQRWSLPLGRIIDQPRFRWRGFHLDVSRHFFPKEWIMKMLDVAARYKINVFHWHLTDDQGWRIEIKQYPRLTDIGAWRRETMEDGQPYGGFYTQEDIKEVVDYARRRFITVVPEIEMPGHCQAALAAYPALSCSGGPFKVATEWGVMNDVFCAGAEETFTFLENVLAEILELFPSPFIHIGGDEVPKLRWHNCARCQERIKQEGLRDESELQSYFIRRIEKFLNAQGRRLIGWDEILEGGLAPNAAVMSWRGMAGGIEAARSGHDVVMSPTSHCYFDYYQGRVDEPKAIGGFLPLEKVYSFEPIPPGLSASEASHILGAQANLWTEYISSTDHAEYMLFPRLVALAEVVWSWKKKGLADFSRRLLNHYDRLTWLGINYRVPPPEGLGGRQIISGKIKVSLTTPLPGAKILYTLDGENPRPDSLNYTIPIDIWDNTILRAATQLPNGRMSLPVSKYFFRLDPAVNGLVYDYYEGGWERLPDLSRETPLRSGTTFDLSLEGIETRPDNFALRFQGELLLDQPGEYKFITRADDGLRLVIDEQVVVENWGLFGQREIKGKISLTPGRHRLVVDYFEKRGNQFLEIFIEGPGLPYQPIPPGRLFRQELESK